MIHSFDYSAEKIGDFGEVVASHDYMVHVLGMAGARVGEGVVFETGQRGYVTKISEENVSVVMFSKDVVASGVRVVRTGQKLSISCGDGMLGHMISPLGYVIDGGKDASTETEPRNLDQDPWGIDRRSMVKDPLLTGTTLVDLTLPLGAGQRELIIGERKTGKTWFVLETLAEQINNGKVGIYCGIGKQVVELMAVKEWLIEKKVWDNVVMVGAGARDNQAEVVLAPYTALCVAEYFRDKGIDSVVVLDDMTTHAKYYREMSLVLGKFPGRDSYPGDTFYEQSRLLERAGSFNVNGKAVTITCLPIAESIGGELTGYVQTNLMSITDGHIYFDLEKYQKGMRPAINIFLSVTRVGRQTRSELFHSLSSEIYSALKRVDAAKVFMKFGPEQTAEVKRTLALGENLEKLFTQKYQKTFEEWEMLFLLGKYFTDVEVTKTPEDLLKVFQNKTKLESWKKKLEDIETMKDLLSTAAGL